MSIDDLLRVPPIIFVTIGALSAAVITNIMMLFLCYRKLEPMEALLNKCRLVAFHSSFWGNSPRERMMRLCAVYCVVALPRLNAWRGVADLEQAQAFPRKTKILLHTTFLLCALSLTGMTVVALD